MREDDIEQNAVEQNAEDPFHESNQGSDKESNEARDKKSDPHYPIGYGRPPTTTQFKKGASGNPRGRPKGSQNFKTVLEKELNVLVSVTENGRRKTVRKKNVIAKQLVNKAAGGDLRAAVVLLNETRLHEHIVDMASTDASTPTQFPAHDRVVIASMLERVRRYEPETNTNDDDNSDAGCKPEEEV